MPFNTKASLPVIHRLPKYLRYLNELKAEGVKKISSSGLAKLMGTTASQVRQDFNCFGGFGQQGIGYQVDVLISEIDALLFTKEKLGTILIGTGRLGRAISGYLTQSAKGYELLGSFDINPDEIGKELCGAKIYSVDNLDEFCKMHKPRVAVLCVPKAASREIAPKLVELGIKGFWNFSHYDLRVNFDNITVENVHLGDSLASLGYRVRTEWEND